MTQKPAPSTARAAVVQNPVLRILLLMAGWLSVALGVAGIVLPVLPTTPFLILASVCFVRSSPRFDQWLLQHRLLGPYLKVYLDGKGLPRKAKIWILALLWTTILTSVIFFVALRWAQIAMLLVACAVTIYIIRLPQANAIKSETN